MKFRKPDLRPSSGKKAPELDNPFGRAVPSHRMVTDEMQEKGSCVSEPWIVQLELLLPIWTSYLTRFQIRRCSTRRDGGLSPKHAAGVLYCQKHYVFICSLYKQNHATFIAWVELCGKLRPLTAGSLQHAFSIHSTTNSPSMYQPPPPPSSSSSSTKYSLIWFVIPVVSL